MQKLILLFLLILLTSCQTPLTDSFNLNVVPEDPVPYALSLPLTFPAGLILSIVDIVIVNPVYGAIEAPAAVSRFWDFGKDNPGLHASLIPAKAIGTPFFFLGYIIFGEQFLPLSNWSWFKPKGKKKKKKKDGESQEETSISDQEREQRRKEAEMQMEEIKELDRN